MERLSPRPEGKTTRGILDDPPQVILIFDNYRGQSQAARRKAELTMLERCITAMTISRARTLYTESSRPKFVCFAGEHTKDSQPGSLTIEETLLKLGATEDEIETRKTTITTTTDITQLHSYIKENRISEPVAIVTSADHVERTEQEAVNHFNQHNSPQHPIPKIYVASSASQEVAGLRLPTEVINSSFFSDNVNALAETQQDGSLKGGRTENIARSISQIKGPRKRKIIQELAEFLNHQHTPITLRRIKRLKGQFRKGRENLYVKKDDREPKTHYTLPPC